MTRLLALVALCAMSAAVAQDVRLPPSYGEAEFSLHPPGDIGHVVALEAGGNIRADALGPACSGIIANAPDYRFTYRAGGSPLRIEAGAAAPIMLLVSDAAGNWHCAQSRNEPDEFRARIDFAAPGTGTYDIWVGTMTAPIVPARLVITEPSAAADHQR